MQNATDIQKFHVSIKRKIKSTFKKHLCSPPTVLEDYLIGRVLGKGAYGKVNLAVHKLAMKVCAVKSINKELCKTKNDQLRVVNERFMVI